MTVDLHVLFDAVFTEWRQRDLIGRAANDGTSPPRQHRGGEGQARRKSRRRRSVRRSRRAPQAEERTTAAVS
jgi:hypothetical protein